MAAKFVAASSQYLKNPTPPFTVMPFTVAAWAKPSSIAAGSSVVFSWCSTGGDILLYRGAANWSMWNNAAATTIGTAVVDRWFFVLMRLISGTNLRGSVYDPAKGAVTHGAAVSASIIAPTQLVIGADIVASPGSFYGGLIGEWWITNTDIQPGGAVAEDSLIRYLALRGPFAVPSIGQTLVDYMSMRSSLPFLQDRQGESINGIFGRQTWQNFGGVTIAPDDPPILGGYRGPRGTRSTITVPI